MNKYGLTEKEQVEILALIKKYPEIDEVILFGSRAMNTFTKISDIDLALKGDNISRIIGSLVSDFEDSSLIYEVDVIDYHGISSEALLEHIRKYGKVFYRKGWVETMLGEEVEYVNKKISIEEITLDNYVSTENILPDKGGVVKAASLPKVSKVNAFEVGDTLFSNIRTYFKKVWFSTKRGGASNDVLIFRPIDSERLDKEYLFRVISNNNFIEYTVVTAKGTKMPRGDKDAIKQYALNLPPLPEQKAIAAVLSAFDDKIELLREQNQTLETLAQTIFKEWFVHFNFPDKDGKPYRDNGGEMVDSELGKIPKGWRVGQLKEFGKIICGKTPPKSKTEYFGGDIPFIKIPDMHNQVFIITTSDTLIEQGKESQKLKTIPANSILVSCIATVGLVGISIKESQTNQQINTIVPQYEYYREYLYLDMLRKNKFLNDIGSGGTATLNVNTGIFSNIEMIIPEKELLIEFSKLAKPIFDKMYNNTAQIQTLSKTRDTLLPKLMSGQTRVKGFEQ